MATEILTVSDQFSPSSRRKAVCAFLRSFAGSGDTQFQFSHFPSTDGKTVWLGEHTLLADCFETLALGHGIHEMMHVEHTDFEKGQSVHNLIHRLLNVVEDVRIDRLGEEKSPAYRIWREKLADYREADGTLRAVTPQKFTSAPIECVVTWLHCELMAHAGYRWALRNLSQTRDLVRPMPKSIRRALLKESLKVDQAKSTGDCLKIAHKLFKILTRFKDEQSLQQTPTGEPETGKTANLFESHEGENTSENNPAEFIEKLFEQPMSSAPATQYRMRRAQLLTTADTVGAGICDVEPESSYRLNRWPSDSSKLRDCGLRREFIRQFQELQKNLGSLTQKFSQLLKTKDYFADYGFHKSGSDLRDDWVDAMACSDHRLFEVAATGKSVSAEICVLLDRSGSMGVLTMTLAKAAVTALVRAVDRIKGTASRVALFPGLDNDHIALLKDTKETLASFEHKLPPVDAYGATPIQEAMRWGLDSFKLSRARNKLLVIITDGRFNAQYAQSMQEKLKAAGVEFALMSIGINNSEAARNHVLVHQPDQINSGLLQLMSQTEFARTLTR